MAPHSFSYSRSASSASSVSSRSSFSSAASSSSSAGSSQGVQDMEPLQAPRFYFEQQRGAQHQHQSSAPCSASSSPSPRLQLPACASSYSVSCRSSSPSPSGYASSPLPRSVADTETPSLPSPTLSGVSSFSMDDIVCAPPPFLLFNGAPHEDGSWDTACRSTSTSSVSGMSHSQQQQQVMMLQHATMQQQPQAQPHGPLLPPASPCPFPPLTSSISSIFPPLTSSISAVFPPLTATISSVFGPPSFSLLPPPLLPSPCAPVSVTTDSSPHCCDSASDSGSPESLEGLDRVTRHRRVDGMRRRKEAALLQQLDQLTQSDEEQMRLRTDSRAAQPGGRAAKRDKARVLAASVDRIRQLEEQVALLSRAQQQQLQLQPCPSPSSVSSLSSVAASSSLATLLQSPFCLLLFDVQTGAMVDANARFRSIMGWTPDKCSGSSACTSNASDLKPALPSAAGDAALPSLSEGGIAGAASAGEGAAAAAAAAVSSSAALNGGDGAWPGVSQYPSSVQKLVELYQGRRSSVLAVWRYRRPCGRICEALKLSWLTQEERETLPDGRSRQVSPRRLVFFFDPDMEVAPALKQEEADSRWAV